MTNKEALEILTKTDRVGVNLIFANDEETTKYNQDSVEALALAIEALKERPQGYWFLLDECSNEGVYCSNCRKKVYRVEYANQKVKSNYCPNCGADMRGDDNEQGLL